MTRCRRPPRQLVINPLALILAFGVSAAAGWIGTPIGFCLMQRFAGIPCPGCGITRSIEALLRCDVRGAIAANVTGPAVIVFFAAQLVLLFAATCDAASEESILRAVRASDRALLAVLLLGWVSRLSAIATRGGESWLR